MLHQQIQGHTKNQGFIPVNVNQYNKPFLEQEKNKRGQRGRQKISASGHLAPTIQTRDGVCYPRISSVYEQERRARLGDHPEDVPYWYIWLFQWSEKDTLTGFWRTRSKTVPVSKILLIKKAIAQKRGIAQILKIIES